MSPLETHRLVEVVYLHVLYVDAATNSDSEVERACKSFKFEVASAGPWPERGGAAGAAPAPATRKLKGLHSCNGFRQAASHACVNGALGTGWGGRRVGIVTSTRRGGCVVLRALLRAGPSLLALRDRPPTPVARGRGPASSVAWPTCSDTKGRSPFASSNNNAVASHGFGRLSEAAKMAGSKINVDEFSLTHQATADVRNSRTRAPTARLYTIGLLRTTPVPDRAGRT